VIASFECQAPWTWPGFFPESRHGEATVYFPENWNTAAMLSWTARRFGSEWTWSCSREPGRYVAELWRCA
jgi:hypothetical protein